MPPFTARQQKKTAGKDVHILFFVSLCPQIDYKLKKLIKINGYA